MYIRAMFACLWDDIVVTSPPPQVHTKDIGGIASTSSFVGAVVKNLSPAA